MRLLLASSEVHPFSKTGGLADMVGALAKYLAQAGHEVELITPLYAGLRERFPAMEPTSFHFDLPLGSRTVHGALWRVRQEDGPTIHFLRQDEFFDRPGLYGPKGSDYPDNAERFVFFSKAVVHFARYGTLKPDLIHVHDWQAGLVPLFVRHQRMQGGWNNAPATCLTIHNLAYQGNFPEAQYALTNLPRDYFHFKAVEFYGLMNCLKAGIVFADQVTTVSPRYAREITTEEFGCGLDGVLRERQGNLVGILNGVDYEEWNTTENPWLKVSYDAKNLEGKAAAKDALQGEMGLPQDPAIPVFGSVTRLVEQKGVDIALGALAEMLAAEMQFVLLGSGSPEFERAYLGLAARFPSKVGVRIGYDHGLAHRIEAGADFFLMPSSFEPCGLNQMYSLRYGTVPIVRVTGGLDDSVTDITENLKRANGIKFFDYSQRALTKAIRKALVLFADKNLLERYRRNGMQADFSWRRTTAEYLKMFRALVSKTKAGKSPN